MKRIHLLTGMAVLLGALTAAACMSHAEQRQSFTIVWNYDTSGYLETCGCSSHQLGGLPRRATLLAGLRAKQPVLAIEGAHIVEDKGDFQLFKGEMIVRLLGTMGYNALMLGVREAQHGAEGIAKLREGAKFPLFSANLLSDGKPAAERGVTLEVAGNKVYVTGVSQPDLVTFELPAGISFDDPGTALDAALAARPAASTMTIICLEGESTWVEGMTKRYAERADLFLSGDRSEGSTLDFKSPPPVLNNHQLGKYTGVLTVDPAQTGYVVSGLNMPLQDTYKDAPEIRGILDTDYKTQLKDRFFGSMKDQLKKLYMPPDSCADCHQEAYAAYAKSGHAHALITLQDKGQLYNPDCMKCHVSYDSGEDKLVAMDCTTCHTNITEDHVWQAVNDPKSIVKPNPPVTTYTYTWCSRCHDPANSARFAEHWPQMVHHIAHGGDLKPAEQAAQQLGIKLTDEPPPH
jgi:hypothetical protein